MLCAAAALACGPATQPLPSAAPQISARDHVELPTSATAPPPGHPAADAATPPPAVEAPAALPSDRLAPYYSVDVSGGWVRVLIQGNGEADAPALEPVAATGETLWRGHRLEPEVLKSLAPIHIVSTRGVTKAETYARFSADAYEGRWTVEYRGLRVKAPAVAMAGTPSEQATLRASPKPKRINRKHALAQRLREEAARSSNPWDPARVASLTSYTLQEVPGTFPSASRVVLVTANNQDPESFDYCTLIVTLDADGREQQRVLSAMIDAATGAGDLDGDGFDELLVRGEGYEEAAESLYRFTSSGVARIELWESSL